MSLVFYFLMIGWLLALNGCSNKKTIEQKREANREQAYNNQIRKMNQEDQAYSNSLKKNHKPFTF